MYDNRPTKIFEETITNREKGEKMKAEYNNG